MIQKETYGDTERQTHRGREETETDNDRKRQRRQTKTERGRQRQREQKFAPQSCKAAAGSFPQ